YPYLNDTTASTSGSGVLGQFDRWSDPWSSTASPYLTPSFATDGEAPTPAEQLETDQRQSASDWPSPATSFGEHFAAPPLQHLDTANYWPAQSTSQNASSASSHPWYLSPVPRAPVWDSIATGLADNPAQTFEEPSGPTSSGGVAQASTATSEPS